MGQALALVQDMEAALGRSETDLSPWFHEDFIWDGNRGCGVKRGLSEFVTGWQIRWRAFLSDRSYHTEKWLEDGEWVACFGEASGRHTGPFMGIAATGKPLCIPYIDFWQIRDGRIAYNKVSVDLAEALHQLGHDVFGGHGFDGSNMTQAV